MSDQVPIEASASGANQSSPRFVLHSGASLFYEEDLKADGSSEARAYLTGPLGVVAVHTTPSTGAATLTYWHRDHLGSLTVTTNDTGAVKDRMRFDPWGRGRGFAPHAARRPSACAMQRRRLQPI